MRSGYRCFLLVETRSYRMKNVLQIASLCSFRPLYIPREEMLVYKQIYCLDAEAFHERIGSGGEESRTDEGA